jgi:hypothetical protein
MSREPETELLVTQGDAGPEAAPVDPAILADARQRVRAARAWWDRADRRQLTLQWMKQAATSEDIYQRVDVASLARDYGWDIADQALRPLIVGHLKRGEMLPTTLAAYTMRIVSGFRLHRPVAPEDIADQPMRHQIVERINRLGRGETLPPELNAYTIELVSGPRFRLPVSPEASDRILGGLVLVALVGDLCSRFDMKPIVIRRRKRPLPAGCRVLSLALAVENPAAGLSGAEIVAAAEAEVKSAWKSFGSLRLLRSRARALRVVRAARRAGLPVRCAMVDGVRIELEPEKTDAAEPDGVDLASNPWDQRYAAE